MANKGWEEAEAVASDSAVLDAEVHRLRRELRDVRATLAGAEAELAEFTAMAEEATGHHNDRQNIHYHHRVKVAPARHCSPRHKDTVVFMRRWFKMRWIMWRAISARP